MKTLINPNFCILQDIKLIMPTVLILLFTLFIMVNIISISISISISLTVSMMMCAGDSDPVCFLFSDQATAGSAGTGGQRLVMIMMMETCRQ